MITLWPLLLPVAAYTGWTVAKRQSKHSLSTPDNRLSREYVVGLNYLLNEQPDKAVDVFIKLLDVDSETVETHLALGSLFRRRGEVDRAIRIHQNLIARPQLTAYERRDALIALGQDYMSAGMFDRAERIFLEVLELGGGDTTSLKGLLDIYQQEKSWERALEITKKLEHYLGENMNYKLAHYYCEIAQRNLKDNQYDLAQLHLKQALNIDPQSVRASIMQALIDIQHQRYKPALKALKRVLEQDPAFLSEIIDPLVQCYKSLDQMDECVDYLLEALETHPRSSIIFVIAEFLKREKGVDLAVDFVAEKLNKHPSIRGLNRLISWHLETAHGKVREKLQMLYDITSKFLDNKPIYRCKQCGFGAKHLHWHCPSCKQWGKMKPVHGLEGD